MEVMEVPEACTLGVVDKAARQESELAELQREIADELDTAAQMVSGTEPIEVVFPSAPTSASNMSGAGTASDACGQDTLASKAQRLRSTHKPKSKGVGPVSSLLVEPQRGESRRSKPQSTGSKGAGGGSILKPLRGRERAQEKELAARPTSEPLKRSSQTKDPVVSLYTSPPAAYTSSDNTGMITVSSSVVENNRHIQYLDDMRELQDLRGGGERVLTMASEELLCDSENESLWDRVASALGVHTPTQRIHEVKKSAKEMETARRDLRIRLSMDDPNIGEVHKKAHRLFVAGSSLNDMRAAGVNIRHLIEIGVKFDDWCQRCDMGLKELAFMGGDWDDALRMGFLPIHMTKYREKSGPSVLVSHPFQLTWDDLERDMGVSIDEAVANLEFSTADFAVFGETMKSLVTRGLAPIHMYTMQEPPLNFEMSLGATPEVGQYCLCF